MASTTSCGPLPRGGLHVARSECAAEPRGHNSGEMQQDEAVAAAAAAGRCPQDVGGHGGSRSRWQRGSSADGKEAADLRREEAAAAQQQQVQLRRRSSRAGERAFAAGGDDGVAADGDSAAAVAAGTGAPASAGRPGGKIVAAADRKTGIGSSKEQRLFYGAFLLLGSTIAVSQVIALPVLLQMLLYTGPILYIGSHASLRQNEVDACTGERPNRTESMNHTDALLFPVFGSIALVTMYVAYKFLDASWVNFLLTLYLTAIGFFALGETVNVLIHPFLPASWVDETRVSFHMRLPHIPLLLPARPAAADAPSSSSPVTEGGSAGDRKAAADSAAGYHFSRSFAQLLSYGVAAVLSCIWLWKKNWVVHNLLAIAFCIQAIGLVSVGNFTVATILLSGLFVYDIFWVFGTDVMVTVAQSFEGPAKLIFPVQLKPWQQSILGLGDVVVPGVLISMCLRFDYWLHGAGNSSSSVYCSSSRAREVARAAETAEAAAAGDPRVSDAATAGAAAAEGGAAVLTRRGKAARAAAAANAEGETLTAPHAEQQLDKESSSSSESSASVASHCHLSSTQAGDIVHYRFNKFYFWVVLIFYECGLITTGVVMLLFQHPQPALLYLVPFCLFALFGAAALNGQVKEVLAYSEDDEGAAAAAAAERSAAAAAGGGAGAAGSTNPAAEEGEEEEEDEEEEGEEEEGQKRKTH